MMFLFILSQEDEDPGILHVVHLGMVWKDWILTNNRLTLSVFLYIQVVTQTFIIIQNRRWMCDESWIIHEYY